MPVDLALESGQHVLRSVEADHVVAVLGQRDQDSPRAAEGLEDCQFASGADESAHQRDVFYGRLVAVVDLGYVRTGVTVGKVGGDARGGQ